MNKLSENPWKILHKETSYENDWIELIHHDVIHPDTSEGVYGVVHYKNIAVGVIPLTEDGYTYLVGQYRFPLRKYSWEIPEGGCPFHENPEQAALRELREETGIIASHLEIIVDGISLSNSVSDESGKIYLARGLKFIGNDPDPSEKLQIRKMKLQKAIEMCLSGEIHDSLSIIGLLSLKNRLGIE